MDNPDDGSTQESNDPGSRAGTPVSDAHGQAAQKPQSDKTVEIRISSSP